VENECFGLPHGGLIVGLIFGLIIVLIGFGLFLQASGIIVNFGNYIWPLILIIFGILIIIAAIYSMQRHAKQQSRSY